MTSRGGCERGTITDRLLFVGVMLFCFGNWLLNGVRHTTADDAVAAGGFSSPFATIVWALIYVAAFVRMYRGRTAVSEIVRASLPLVLILALACVSTIWSDQPILTARRSIELLGTVTLALYFAYRLGLQAFVEALSLAIACAALISLILVIAFPAAGRDPDNSFAWSGIFAGRNFLGQTMAIGLVTAACLVGRLSGRIRMLQIAAIPLYLLLLIESKTGAGAGIALTLAFFIPIMTFSRTKRSLTIALIGAIALAAVVIVGLRSDDILALFGKDPTLTGRTMLWQLVVGAITQRPALGYGYAAFWGLDAPAASSVYPYLNWVPGTAHNGFLEIALNCGIVGEIIFIWLLALALRRASAMFWRGRDLLAGWPLFAMLCVVLKNVSDASLLAHGDADWIVFVAAFFLATEASGARVFPQQKDLPSEVSKTSDVFA